MQADFVFVAQGDGDSALGVLGGRVGDFSLGQDEYAAGGSEFDGSPQSGNSRSNYQEVSLGGRLLHRQKWYHAEADAIITRERRLTEQSIKSRLISLWLRASVVKRLYDEKQIS